MSCPAAVLAGGQSRRMGGGDKSFLPLGTATMLDRILARLLPQAGPVLINSNRDPALFSRFRRPVRGDVLPGCLGPLAGILTAMRWADGIGATQVATVPCDTPFLPDDLIARLAAAATHGGIVIAGSGGDIHPVIGLWPVELADRLEEALQNGQRRVQSWLDRVGFAVASFENRDAFRNLNTIADWRATAPSAQHHESQP